VEETPQAEFERRLREMLDSIRRALSEIDVDAVPGPTAAADRETSEHMRSLLADLLSIMDTVDIEAVDLGRAPTAGGSAVNSFGTAGTYGSINGTTGTFGTYGTGITCGCPRGSVGE
jgi:hypothetical protein